MPQERKDHTLDSSHFCHGGELNRTVLLVCGVGVGGRFFPQVWLVDRDPVGVGRVKFENLGEIWFQLSSSALEYTQREGHTSEGRSGALSRVSQATAPHGQPGKGGDQMKRRDDFRVQISRTQAEPSWKVRTDPPGLSSGLHTYSCVP